MVLKTKNCLEVEKSKMAKETEKERLERERLERQRLDDLAMGGGSR